MRFLAPTGLAGGGKCRSGAPADIWTLLAAGWRTSRRPNHRYARSRHPQVVDPPAAPIAGSAWVGSRWGGRAGRRYASFGPEAQPASEVSGRSKASRKPNADLP